MPTAHTQAVEGAAWSGSLSLRFQRLDGRTILARRAHAGPLVVQKTLYPEGNDICHAVVVHPPGGIVGGDRLAIDVALDPGARVLVTTPSAAKWYRSDAREAQQTNALAVGPGAILEWLPQETIIFESALARTETDIDLAADAAFAGWDITCFGRRASGESFATGRLRQRLAIRRAGRLIWNERLALAGGDRLLRSPVGLGDRHVSGLMVIAAGPLPPGLLERCRALAPRYGECGVTALPEIAAARFLGASAEHAKDYFEALRAVLRPWYAARPAMRPRLWAT